MKIKEMVTPLALFLALGTGAGSVLAQPNGEDGLETNPPNQQQGGGGGRGGNRPNFRDMTPEQRAQMQQQMQQMREQGIRQMLTQVRVTDQAVQNSVVDYVNAGETARNGLQEKAQAVRAALRNNATTDDQLKTLLADFRAAIAAEKTRREAALKELAEDTNYAENPRLDAVLTLNGIIGDEASVLNGAMGGGGGRGGRGGFGGGPGGGFGGQGGGGGRNNRNN